MATTAVTETYRNIALNCSIIVISIILIAYSLYTASYRIWSSIVLHNISRYNTIIIILMDGAYSRQAIHLVLRLCGDTDSDRPTSYILLVL